MTSKNLLYNIVNLTRILHYRTAWRLRSVIFILIFSICTLSGLNKSFAQQFRSQIDSSKYPALTPGAYIPLNSGEAILAYKIQPVGHYNNVVDAYILPTVSYSQVTQGSTFGWTYVNGTSTQPESWQIIYQVINPTTVFSRSNSTVSNSILRSIQAILETKNLGLVSQRKLLIDSYSGALVNPTDFRGYIQPWIIVGLVIAILIPAWYLCRRFLRG